MLKSLKQLWPVALVTILLSFPPVQTRAQVQEPPAPPPAPSRTAQDHEALGEDGESGRIVRDRVIYGANFLLKTNEVVNELVIIGGSADIQGEVRGSMVLIGGKAKVSGTIRDDVVIVLGGLEMLPGARIRSDVVMIGGPFQVPDTAEIIGERIEIPIGDFVPQIEWFKAWLFQGLLFGRLLPFGVHWAWAAAGFFILVYFLVLVVFPGAVKNIVTALEERPVASVTAGLLALILFAPLLVVLAITVVGLLVIPFVMVAFFLALLFGKVGVFCFVGRNVGRSSGLSALQHPIAAFLIGAILITLAYTIPICGIIAFAVATVFGLGGAVIALTGKFKREEAYVPPAPVMVGTIVRPSPDAPVGGPAGNPLASMTAAASLNPSDTIMLPRVGFWKRAAATTIDLVLLSLLLPFTGPLFVLVAIFYFVGMWTWKGTTVGGVVLGLKVVRTDGLPVNFAVALVRSLVSVFSALALLLGFFWAGWDRDKQSWHDKIAGTIVVQMPRDFALI